MAVEVEGACVTFPAMANLTTALLIRPGEAANLNGRDPADTLGLQDKATAAEQRDALIAELAELQARLWAEHTRGLLLVLQGMDGSGKDSTIKRVFAGLNPLGCRVVPFGKPHREELDHDYLWRIHKACPSRGEIAIFNRSHYEDVAVVRVLNLVEESVWRRRFAHIRDFERMLVDEGTAIVKVFLQISKDEQRQRLQDRIDDPTKHWKWNPDDLNARADWDRYRQAYDEALTETSTDQAPWAVVPANRKWVRDVAVLQLLVDRLRKLDPQYPEAPPDLAGVVVE